jgi:hypothetical protein
MSFIEATQSALVIDGADMLDGTVKLGPDTLECGKLSGRYREAKLIVIPGRQRQTSPFIQVCTRPQGLRQR